MTTLRQHAAIYRAAATDPAIPGKHLGREDMAIRNALFAMARAADDLADQADVTEPRISVTASPWHEGDLNPVYGPDAREVMAGTAPPLAGPDETATGAMLPDDPGERRAFTAEFDAAFAEYLRQRSEGGVTSWAQWLREWNAAKVLRALVYAPGGHLAAAVASLSKVERGALLDALVTVTNSEQRPVAGDTQP